MKKAPDVLYEPIIQEQKTLRLPFNFTPRKYQLPLFNYLTSDIPNKRACVVAHRRAGKDLLTLHATACMAWKQPGNYWHMFPKFSQCRRALWDGIDGLTGRRILDSVFPPDIVESKHEHEMQITLKNGSKFSLVGSDDPDRLVGAPPVWITMSEAALSVASTWSYLRPILAQNRGALVLISTPRGDNWFKAIYESAVDDPTWFTQLLTVDDTHVFNKQTLETELRELMRERGPEEGRALYDQEYRCSFSAPLSGSYFGSFMSKAEEEGRIGTVPYDPLYPVHLSFDLGINDMCVIWAGQNIRGQIRFIECISGSGHGLQYYIDIIKSKGWVTGNWILPHDAAQKEITSARSRLATFRSLGINNIQLLPKDRIAEGIQAARSMLPTCHFDAKGCLAGIRALKEYRRDYNAVSDIYEDRPVHDKNSDYADSFRYWALGNTANRPKQEIKYKSNAWVV